MVVVIVVIVVVVVVVVVVVLDILNLYCDPPRAGLDKLRYAVSTQILVVLRERNHISFDTEEVKEGRLPIAKETVNQCAKWGVGKDGIQPLMQVWDTAANN